MPEGTLPDWIGDSITNIIQQTSQSSTLPSSIMDGRVTFHLPEDTHIDEKDAFPPYSPSSNVIPNISASSAVILSRECVISGRIRPFLYSCPCPHPHLSILLVMAPAIITC
jgi:hypothetical protein